MKYIRLGLKWLYTFIESCTYNKNNLKLCSKQFDYQLS